jgi:inner membrane protein involved in colicin E2 resistance
MPYFAWYRSPSYIFWIITASLVAFFALEHIKLIKFPFNIYKWVPVGFSLVIFFIASYMFARSINFTSKLYTARYNTALWITENFLPDSIFASWNAGQLGFFSNRTFINLDGVINSVDYYERVLRGSPNNISDNNVGYIVDYDTYGFYQISKQSIRSL